MEYIRVGSKIDFKQETIRSYRIFGKIIAILKKENGIYEAVEASCKHQGADLTTGEIKGWVVTCPRHGWKYDLESGQCLNHDSLPLKRYDVRIEGDEIHISFQPIDE